MLKNVQWLTFFIFEKFLLLLNPSQLSDIPLQEKDSACNFIEEKICAEGKPTSANQTRL